MIDVYYGEFLTSPCPLELSFNACSHACVYCFANLNKPDRVFNAPATLRFLAKYHQRHTLAATLLQQGYPVVISNRCDPFAASNYRQALPILETMTALEIPMQFQTRGGYGIDTALAYLKPAVWYISIETDNPDLARRLSPGGPDLPARWALVEQLIGLGHGVVLGMNPCVPEWAPDPRAILRRAKRLGVEGVWFELLHLDSKRQTKRMTPDQRATLGPHIMRKATAIKHKPDLPHLLNARDIALEEGLEIYSGGQPNKSAFFDIYRRYYEKTFPVLQDYINTLPDDPNFPLEFDQFAAFMLKSLPTGEYQLAHYLGATGHDLWRRYTIPAKMTYKQLLSILWQEPSTRYSLVRSPAFAFALIEHDGGLYQLTDEHGLPCLSYGNHESYYHTVV